MILEQDSNQKITDKNGVQINIGEYKDKTDKNEAIQGAINLDELDQLEFSQSSMYSDDMNNENTAGTSFKSLIGIIHIFK